MVWSMPKAGKTVKIIINRGLWAGRGTPRPTQSPRLRVSVGEKRQPRPTASVQPFAYAITGSAS